MWVAVARRGTRTQTSLLEDDGRTLSDTQCALLHGFFEQGALGEAAAVCGGYTGAAQLQKVPFGDTNPCKPDVIEQIRDGGCPLPHRCGAFMGGSTSRCPNIACHMTSGIHHAQTNRFAAQSQQHLACIDTDPHIAPWACCALHPSTQQMGAARKRDVQVVSGKRALVQIFANATLGNAAAHVAKVS
eukprot:CAMPEP_0181211062 /NCGR_PEP_ID=MMETSP1096-20121128/23581_1 /TAXON_ID=156174 ORGANISM="Chrysochromulina ericina, Strain CCMP281" /NCGR_SAMPLE_ID=MMETSP1096 /ASSEMBLY_ACC=CAM_ASM_000453 /LENGTH=186 /DNA_ID=CAMNT_0023302429 /DNA_START=495 /DNA_END=1053 /DNA_ORIENTATION=-